MQKKSFPTKNTKKGTGMATTKRGGKRKQPEGGPRAKKNCKQLCLEEKDDSGICNPAGITKQKQYTEQAEMPGQESSHITQVNESVAPEKKKGK